jgi:ABC-type Na+ efflux pump permease subunit
VSVGAIARHEARRAFAVLDKRTGFALLAVVVLLAASWPVVRSHPIAPQDGLYPYAVASPSPLEGAAASDARFRKVDGGRTDLVAGHVALVLEGDAVLADDTDERSRAALLALSQAAARWLEDRLALEPDQAAAFPVTVNVLLVREDFSATGSAIAGGGRGGGQGGPTFGPSPSSSPSPGPSAPVLVGNVSGAEPRLALRPSEVDPPFPVRSLLLTFAFLIPMNLVAQLCAGSLLAERIRHRGLLLLTTPLSGPAILLGRVLPHLGVTLAVVLVAGLAIGAGWQGFAAALPMVLLVLALAAVLGLLARNERELTFLLTAATTMLSTFLFLPAIFTTLPPVAYLSPVSVVAASVDGRTVAWGPFLYATIPLTLATVALGFLAAGLYREETLFATRGLATKGMDGVRRLVRRRPGVVAAGVLAVPFALALELFILTLVIPLGLRAAFPVFVLGVAFIEEALKLVPARAHAQGGHRGWLAGALSGTGFFLGEKLALLVALAGFGLLPNGSTSLALWGIGGSALVLVAPLALHAGCSAVAASGTRRGGGWAALAWLAAAVLHAGYNTLLLAGVLR